ncbi:hypothetical protein BOTBODRAFT_176475 [Botryobasidium botryosum FD-172 SS1]|uniref:Protein kinase domain-containing protein n=1 Tax=Botryobasidium botryosum (strain FD-172 SS1) TaxID=930990 RepID=A0A067M9T4_BOTB1|nr:hypothetical protein BOTBODRAFT_176475 [Botryobasidium botryosum FD-172 SS1]
MTTSAAAGALLEIPTRADPFDIYGDELFWVDYQPFFSSRGYQLRPRYRPGWVKSWAKTRDTQAEDAIRPIMPESKVMDSTRTSDGRAVALKKLSPVSDAKEIEITRYFSQESLLSEVHNHCVLLLDILDPEDGSNIVFLVVPLLRYYDQPQFESLEDAVDFIRQTLEGLDFMHEQRVAHRDCARFNIMMDPKHLFPEGYHPQSPDRSVDAHWAAPRRRRYQVPYPKYYFIDFGLSVLYSEDYQGPRLVTGTDGQDQTVPELLRATQDPQYQYDPFKIDIYTLGNLYKNELISKYRGLSFLTPLADRMTSEEPTDRPSAGEALILLQSCQRQIFSLNLYRQLIPIGQGFMEGLIREGLHLARRATSRRRKE